ncbi:M14 family zinc carboxypeptidase [Rubrivirga sp. IMCC43871]|uniref:M14 family zinc carboxypeptidase n=1 Tax=Rubrivirga sp. IMCC43871 TaxID=3391575 RepID=UPI00398F930E
MTLASLDLSDLRFRTSEEVFGDLRSACEQNPDVAAFETIGESEAGRPIAGVTLGYGPRLATLVAGAHADEPVGPETLRTLILEGLAARDWGAADGGLQTLFEQWTLRIVPHLNPDGEAQNRPWIEWFDASDPAAALGHFLRGRRREAPGRDLEFGYPDLRTENHAASDFLFGGPPVALHASLHGMAVSEGALLLIERRWLGTDRDVLLRAAFVDAARHAGLPLYDHDRGGDKGFRYGGPGFWSTPEGAAMRQHFLDAGDPETADRFRRSSMEQALTTAPASESPLCVVTELPLFRLAHRPGQAGVPEALLAFREEMPALIERAAGGDDLGDVVERYGITCPDTATQVRLHLQALDAALATA